MLVEMNLFIYLFILRNLRQVANFKINIYSKKK